MTPQDKKYLQYGGIALGIGVVLYFVLQSKDNGGAYNDPTGNATTTPSNTTFNAKAVAETLYNAMREMGTDEKKVINLLRTVSASQFDLVFKAFGSRQYNSTLGNQYNINPFSQLPYVNLQGWLESELSDEEYENLNRKYPTKL